MAPPPVIIVGSGLASYVLATEFRRVDPVMPLEIVTASDGDFYSKPMLSTALKHQKDAHTLVTTDADDMAMKLKATIYVNANVTGIDARSRLLYVDREIYPIPYTYLVLACGATPIHLDIKGGGADKIISVNDLADYAKFRRLIEGEKRVLIMGAGLVGCEFANDLVQAGYEVDVVSLGGHPVERLMPEETAQALKEALEEQGVRWHLNNQVMQVDHEDEAYRVTLADGQRLSTDVVLSAVGLRPNTKVAASSGLAVDEGIVVDRYLRSSDPDIYALGDCAQVNGLNMFFVAPLRRCAMALARTLSQRETAVSYPPMPVLMKTPACPTVVCPPPKGLAGRWICDGQGKDRRALFYDQSEALRGFALTGACIKERAKLTQALPDLF